MQQGPLPAPESENDGGIGKAFSILTGKFDDLIRSKQNKEEQLELAFDVEQETTEDVKSTLKKAIQLRRKRLKSRRNSLDSTQRKKINSKWRQLKLPVKRS